VRRSTQWLAAVVGLQLLAACADNKVTPSAPVGSSTPTTVVSAQPGEVNPGKLTILVPELSNERHDFVFTLGTSGSVAYAALLGGTLLTPGEGGKALPGIAEEWSQSADGRAWTFKIRKGVKFHDGSELTAEDVIWTFKHTFSPEAAKTSVVGEVLRQAAIFESVELSAPDTVVYTTTERNDQFFLDDLMAGVDSDQYFTILPKRDDLGLDPASAAAYDRNPVGAGPMRLVSQEPGRSMVFERFDDYYYQPKNGFPEDRRVKFQTLELNIVSEEATRVAAIEAGQADIALISLPSASQVTASGGRVAIGKKGIIVDPRLIGCWGEPVTPCQDQRVRQALDYALNKEEMRDKLWGGPDMFDVAGWWVVVPGSAGYTPELTPRPFDPDKARQLLADAGYPGGEGFGTLVVNTWGGSSLPFLDQSALVAADYWRKELGLNVEVKVGDRDTVKAREKAGELHGQILWRDNDPAAFPASKVLDSYGSESEGPRGASNDPELWRMVDAALNRPESAAMEADASKLYVQLRDLTYHITVGVSEVPWALGPRVMTWDPAGPAAKNLWTVTLTQ
jgi:peptide/nickel transport system substrate-binding protein